MTASNPRIFLSAGEASGDQYGAELIAEVRRRLPEATFFGLGGTRMAEAGLERVVKAEDVAVMGITEVILHMPQIYREFRRLVGALKAGRPDVAVLIDFPDVNFRLARELKKLGVPVLYFVSPQLWAWKRRRLRWVQERVDRMMVIFPFEESFYRARGVDAEFVGHPLAELALPASLRDEYARRHGLRLLIEGPASNRKKEWIALLPGSRWKEVRLNLPTMIEAAELLGSGYEFLLPIASTLDRKEVQELVDELSDGSTPQITLVGDAREALFHARGSVVASGTATVQAAVIGNPFVVVYRVSNMTYRVAKRLVRYPAEIPAQEDAAGNLPVGMVNLIAGRRVVPELLQDRFTGKNVAETLAPLLADGPERSEMIAGLAQVRAKLLPALEGDGRRTAIQRVAEAVEELFVGVSSAVAG
ncbi:lipid-A-disaccharide synthase [Granulicella sp. dw_53]|uniref:lipid-A-disaccharide synthase n=1 Tax=Granulicella sp. dw_53 TaxID=2719792 RepID=UPI0031F6D3F5